MMAAMTETIHWMGTREACERLGVTLRTLYRFIDEGQLPAYKMGRVIRVQESDVDDFIKRMRIEPGTLEHLYPEPKPRGEREHSMDEADA
jgi:excisionase family DNA binding protein